MQELEQTQRIAIVGAACRFPGAGSVPELWRLLRDGVDVIGEVPSSRWDIDEYYDPDPKKRGAMYTRWGGFLDGIDQFEPKFFGIAPREAAEMDPQQRLLLEVSWEALEDAGQVPAELAGSRTAVYAGIIAADYTLHHARQQGTGGINAWYASGKEFSFGTGRLSYLLGLNGPSMTVSTACSSSLVAVDLACRSLRDGRADLALAGGVNLILSPELTIFMCKARAMSPTGRCRAFDEAADGIVRGEGCAIVVLKRLEDALAADDDILAVIRGTAVNHDGASAGITAPSAVAQQALLREALAEARVEPGRVDYLEAHATGTPLGDPIEMASLRTVLGEDRPADRPLYVGSLKANIGHTDSAAGVAGLIKAALVIKHGTVPPQLYLDTANPLIPWDWPVRVPAALSALPPAKGPRVAGISAFGLSGTNAHVVIEEPPPRTAAASPEGPVVVPISARSDGALAELATAYRDMLCAPGAPPLADVARTAGTGRAHHPEHRLAVTGRSHAELAARLTAYAGGRTTAGLFHGGLAGDEEPEVVFVFSAHSSGWPGMGRGLLEREPAFREVMEECDALTRWHAGSSVIEALGDSPASAPVTFAVQVALAALWRSYGVEPCAVAGQGSGEIAAACASGALPLHEAIRIIVTPSGLDGPDGLAGLDGLTPREMVLAMAADEQPPVATADRAGTSHFKAEMDALRGGGHRVFVEIGPEAAARPHLTPDTLVVSSLSPAGDEIATLQGALAALYTAGITVHWGAVPPRGGQLAKLPTYRWQRKPYWIGTQVLRERDRA